MAFNLKSGNRPSFKKLGSNSYKPSAVSKSRSPLAQKKAPTTKEWNEGEKNKSSVPGLEEGRTIIEKDLQTQAYKDRLGREVKMFGGEDAEISKASEDMHVGDKYTAQGEIIKNPTAEQILEIRQNRQKNTIWNDPSNTTKEGGNIGFGMHDANRRLSDKEKTELNLDLVKNGKQTNYAQYMPSSNLYFNKDYVDDEGNIQGSEKSKQLAIHEGTHAVTGGKNNMLPATQAFLNNAKGGGKGELAKPPEVYARYKSTQNFLQENGIFDHQSGDEFTNAHVKQIEKLMEGATWENFREKGIPYDVFTFFGIKGDKDNKKISKKDMKTIFNNVADNSSNPNEIIDDGGNSSMFA
jgi:hypothetical protein